MCSFPTNDVYDRHIQSLNYTQQLILFSDIYLCVDIMLGLVKENSLTTPFGIFFHARRMK